MGFIALHGPHNPVPTSVISVFFVLGLAVYGLTGYVTARKSRTSVKMNVLVVGANLMLLGIYGIASPSGTVISRVMVWISWFLTIPLMFVGARLARRNGLT